MYLYRNLVQLYIKGHLRMFVLTKVIKGYYVLTYRLPVTFLNAGFIDTWLLLIYDFSAFRLFESLLQFSDFFCIEKNDHKPEG